MLCLAYSYTNKFTYRHYRQSTWAQKVYLIGLFKLAQGATFSTCSRSRKRRRSDLSSRLSEAFRALGESPQHPLALEALPPCASPAAPKIAGATGPMAPARLFKG